MGQLNLKPAYMFLHMVGLQVCAGSRVTRSSLVVVTYSHDIQFLRALLMSFAGPTVGCMKPEPRLSSN